MIDYFIQLIDGYIYHLLAFGVAVYLVANCLVYKRGCVPDSKNVQVDDTEKGETYID